VGLLQGNYGKQYETMGVIQLTSLVQIPPICEGELIQITSYMYSISRRYFETDGICYRFNPNKVGEGFGAFERIPAEQRQVRYAKMMDEIMALPKESLKALLEGAYRRIER